LGAQGRAPLKRRDNERLVWIEAGLQGLVLLVPMDTGMKPGVKPGVKETHVKHTTRTRSQIDKNEHTQIHELRTSHSKTNA